MVLEASFARNTVRPDRGPVSKVAVGLLPRHGLVFLDGQAVDSQVSRDPVDDEQSPVHVRDKCKHEIATEIPQLHGGTDHG